jgi:hypothetical protein
MEAISPAGGTGIEWLASRPLGDVSCELANGLPGGESSLPQPSAMKSITPDESRISQCNLAIRDS